MESYVTSAPRSSFSGFVPKINESPNSVTLSGISSSVKPVPANAHAPILDTSPVMVTEVRFSQFSNIASVISTDPEITTFSRDFISLKPAHSIFVSLFPPSCRLFRFSASILPITLTFSPITSVSRLGNDPSTTPASATISFNFTSPSKHSVLISSFFITTLSAPQFSKGLSSYSY